MKDKKLYEPIDGSPEKRYPLKKTSKANIKALANVCSMRISSDDEDRASWAEQAGHTPVDWIEVRIDQKTKRAPKYLTEDEKKTATITTSRKPIYQVEDVFTEYHIHAALAPVLFEGFPPIIHLNQTGGETEIEIIEQSLFDNLLEDVVNEAFLEFAGKRNPTSRLLRDFLNQSNGDLNHLFSGLPG